MKERKVPLRRCAGCMESKEKNALIRIAGYEGAVSVDPTGRAKGRGVYLCKDSEDCWKKAFKKKAVERGLRLALSEEQKSELMKQLEAYKNHDQ